MQIKRYIEKASSDSFLNFFIDSEISSIKGFQSILNPTDKAFAVYFYSFCLSRPDSAWVLPTSKKIKANSFSSVRKLFPIVI